MGYSVIFNKQSLEGLVGGKSPLDMPRLNVQDTEQAYLFLRSYGYDLKDDQEHRMLQSLHLRSISYMKEHLLIEGELLPEEVSDLSKMEDLSDLLLMASRREEKYAHLQRWACATLKVMHAFSHLDNDILQMFPDEIKNQILKPFRDHLIDDDMSQRMVLGELNDSESIQLEKFEVKPLKTGMSGVTKLLAKREAHAMTVLDKIGLRFITRNVFDSFRVLRYLHQHQLVSFPNSISDQVTNSLYPLNLFIEAMDELRSKSPDASLDEINAVLEKKRNSSAERAEHVTKENKFSGDDYRFMKFISRRLIRIPLPGRPNLRFFYPFEVQIMDYETYLKNLQGPMAHDEYKSRQRKAARRRVLNFLDAEGSVNETPV